MTGMMTSKTGALLLEVDGRTFRRYLKAYREKDVRIKLNVNELIKAKYFDFNVLYFKRSCVKKDFKIRRELFESGAMRDRHG
jgi:hypothetical protein